MTTTRECRDFWIADEDGTVSCHSFRRSRKGGHWWWSPELGRDVPETHLQRSEMAAIQFASATCADKIGHYHQQLMRLRERATEIERAEKGLV